MRSMTAFASIQWEAKDARYAWEIKSVNHRFLDISLRVPERFKPFEIAFRKCIAAVCQRGRIEVSLRELVRIESIDMQVDEVRLAAYLNGAQALADKYQLAWDIGLSKVMDIFAGTSLQTCTSDPKLLEKELCEQLQNGLALLAEQRLQEGSALQVFLQERLAVFRICWQQAVIEADRQPELLRQRLMQRARDSFPDVLEEQSIVQEAALLALRYDIKEELDRMDAHMNAFEQAVNGAEPQGKRLDFLLQELHREVNTLSAKADTQALSQIAIEMKLFVEQMREQVQNVE